MRKALHPVCAGIRVTFTNILFFTHCCCCRRNLKRSVSPAALINRAHHDRAMRLSVFSIFGVDRLLTNHLCGAQTVPFIARMMSVRQGKTHPRCCASSTSAAHVGSRTRVSTCPNMHRNARLRVMATFRRRLSFKNPSLPSEFARTMLRKTASNSRPCRASPTRQYESHFLPTCNSQTQKYAAQTEATFVVIYAVRVCQTSLHGKDTHQCPLSIEMCIWWNVRNYELLWYI